MKLTVIGTGYVGLVSAICLADFGHHVVGLDTNPAVVAKLSNGQCPLYEPGAAEYLERGLASGRLRFTDSYEEALQDTQVAFLTVGTPEDKNGDADLSYIFAAVKSIATHMAGPLLIVDKSTVPVGTSRQVLALARETLASRGANHEVDVVSNPEFLREGKAVSDFLNPDRIVLGVNGEAAEKQMKKVYSAFERSNKPIVVTNPETAEMIKYASNAFLATKVSFINEVANLCEVTGADVKQVAKAMGMDGRIGSKFLHAGPGYGGSCFPKDTKALAQTGRKHKTPMTIVESVIHANERQKSLSAEKIVNTMPEDGTLAVLGLSFKPETDDIRESPAISIVEYLLEHSDIPLRLYDPEAMDNAKQALAGAGGQITWCASAGECLAGAKAAAIITEWLEFRNIDLLNIDSLAVVYDFRNIFNPEEIEALEKTYYGTGMRGL